MTALLKSLQRVANDFRPKSDRIAAPVVTFPQKSAKALWAVIVVLVAMQVVTGIYVFLLQKDLKQDAEILIHAETPQKISDIILPAEKLTQDFEVPALVQELPLDMVARTISDAPAVADRRRALPQDRRVAFRDIAVEDDETLMRSAYTRLEAGDNQGAIVLYNQILAENRKSTGALMGKMYALQRSGQYEDAVEVGHRLLRLDPGNSAARANLVSALGQSYIPAAQADLQKMLEAAPNDAAVHEALAKQLSRRGYYFKAYEHLERAMQIEPANVSYKIQVAVLYDRAGRNPEALTLYRKALREYARQEGAGRAPLDLRSVRERMHYLEQLSASLQ